MLILPISIFNQPKKQYQNGLFKSGLGNNFPIKNDVIKDCISFQSNTSAGNVLKKLRGIKCPYFGVIMISGSELKRIENQLDKCNCVKDIVKVLSKYKHCMQNTEKKIYTKFVEISQKSPSITLPECLKLLYDEAIIKLKLEEFNVLDDVDKISLNLSPQNALFVHEKTTRCRQIILENNEADTFKRKTLLSSLDEIKPNNKNDEDKILEKLKDRAIYLPTSGTSENAFIVKYVNRSQQEIAKRILRPSVATIEHIQPESFEGQNTIGNFLLASEGANSFRSNMPLYKFIEMFPFIPQKCQNYIEQIINLIHNGQLKGHETYPYKVKQSLAKESNGQIILNLSDYKYSETKALEMEKNCYKKSFKKN